MSEWVNGKAKPGLQKPEHSSHLINPLDKLGNWFQTKQYITLIIPDCSLPLPICCIHAWALFKLQHTLSFPLWCLYYPHLETFSFTLLLNPSRISITNSTLITCKRPTKSLQTFLWTLKITAAFRFIGHCDVLPVFF